MMVMGEYPESCASLSVLIVAYRRWQNVSQILESCHNAGVGDIYLSLDAPNDVAGDAGRDHEAIKVVTAEFEKRTGRSVKKRISTKNQGCAVNVILGCDWAFESATYLAILEDDCLPSKSFFDFYRSTISYLATDETCWLLCGTQLAPESITLGNTSLSRYPLTWGWATNVDKWREIRKAFFQVSTNPELKDLVSIQKEDAFWNAGARRAVRGFTDVWDTVLVQQMQNLNKLAILPGYNLIENNGNDHLATHTKDDSPWIGNSVDTSISASGGNPRYNPLLDEWLRDNVFQIRYRHIITTKLTLLFDFILRKYRRRFGLDLEKRLVT
jgi:hypothetical protein